LVADDGTIGGSAIVKAVDANQLAVVEAAPAGVSRGNFYLAGVGKLGEQHVIGGTAIDRDRSIGASCGVLSLALAHGAGRVGSVDDAYSALPGPRQLDVAAHPVRFISGEQGVRGDAGGGRRAQLDHRQIVPSR
jgi:hypothetical protein